MTPNIEIRIDLFHHRLGKMPQPTRNDSFGLFQSLQKTTIGNENLIDELRNLETYPAPSMYCSYLNKSLVTPVIE